MFKKKTYMLWSLGLFFAGSFLILNYTENFVTGAAIGIDGVLPAASSIIGTVCILFAAVMFLITGAFGQEVVKPSKKKGKKNFLGF